VRGLLVFILLSFHARTYIRAADSLPLHALPLSQVLAPGGINLLAALAPILAPEAQDLGALADAAPTRVGGRQFKAKAVQCQARARRRGRWSRTRQPPPGCQAHLERQNPPQSFTYIQYFRRLCRVTHARARTPPRWTAAR